MTTITAITTPWAALHAAVERRQRLEISYHGHRRIVSPHALGWKAGRALLLAYQSTAGPPADPRAQWRCFYLDQIDHLAAPDDANEWETAENYNPAQPFPAIDDIAIAISQPTVPRPVR